MELMLKVPYSIRTIMEVVFTYAKDCEQWMRVKVEIMKMLRPEERKLFSTAQPFHRQKPNEMEKAMIELWMYWGGKRLRLPQDYE